MGFIVWPNCMHNEQWKETHLNKGQIFSSIRHRTDRTRSHKSTVTSIVFDFGRGKTNVGFWFRKEKKMTKGEMWKSRTLKTRWRRSRFLWTRENETRKSRLVEMREREMEISDSRRETEIRKYRKKERDGKRAKCRLRSNCWPRANKNLRRVLFIFLQGVNNTQHGERERENCRC